MVKRILAAVALVIVTAGTGWFMLADGQSANADPQPEPVITGTVYLCVQQSDESHIYAELAHPGVLCHSGYVRFYANVGITSGPTPSSSPAPSTSPSG